MFLTLFGLLSAILKTESGARKIARIGPGAKCPIFHGPYLNQKFFATVDFIILLLTAVTDFVLPAYPKIVY